jgi:hypothetical protein
MHHACAVCTRTLGGSLPFARKRVHEISARASITHTLVACLGVQLERVLPASSTDERSLHVLMKSEEEELLEVLRFALLQRHQSCGIAKLSPSKP